MKAIDKMNLHLKESSDILLHCNNNWRLCRRKLSSTIIYTGSPQWLPCGMLNRKIAKSFQTMGRKLKTASLFLNHSKKEKVNR